MSDEHRRADLRDVIRISEALGLYEDENKLATPSSTKGGASVSGIACPVCGSSEGVSLGIPGSVNCPRCGSFAALSKPLNFDPVAQGAAATQALLALDEFVKYLEARRAKFATAEDFGPDEGPNLKSWVAATAHAEDHIIGKLRAILEGRDWHGAL